MVDIRLQSKNSVRPPCRTVILSPSRNNRLLKNLSTITESQYYNSFLNTETICVIGVPIQMIFIIVITCHVQFTSTNSIFEKDKGSCTVWLWWEQSTSHLMFISYQSVIVFYLTILQCKLKPCGKINKDCTSKRQQRQEVSV